MAVPAGTHGRSKVVLSRLAYTISIGKVPVLRHIVILLRCGPLVVATHSTLWTKQHTFLSAAVTFYNMTLW